MINWIKCLFGFHEYVQFQRLSDYTHKLKCKNCGKYFAMNTLERILLPWDLEFEDMYRLFDYQPVEKTKSNPPVDE